MESVALLGFPHLGSWGRGSSWPLRTACCTISLQPFERNAAKGKKIHGPTPSSPPRRNYEITPRTPSASRGGGPTIEPCSKKKAERISYPLSGWTVRVGEGQSLILKTSILKTKESGGKGGKALRSRFSCSWILRNHKNP